MPNSDRGRAAAWFIGGVLLGVPLRLALDAVNAIGWFLLGLASGEWGSRSARLRVGLSAFGVAAFTSWASLAFHGVRATGDILIAFIEVGFGVLIAVIGHLATMPRGRDL